MMTVKELAVKMNREASAGLARNLKAMPEDKAAWHPMDVGRNALDQAMECGGLNLVAARSLTTRENPVFDPEAYAKLQAETDTVEKAVALLDKGTTALLAAIEAFPDEHLNDPVTLPFGPGGMTMTFAELMLLSYWNVVYHIGQVAYIQTLYGDKEMH